MIKNFKCLIVADHAGNPTEEERVSTNDLLVLTTIDELLFISKILFTFVTKQATLTRRSTVLSLPLQLAFPGSCIKEPDQ